MDHCPHCGLPLSIVEKKTLPPPRIEMRDGQRWFVYDLNLEDDDFEAQA
jgi:hypothetical protein